MQYLKQFIFGFVVILLIGSVCSCNFAPRMKALDAEISNYPGISYSDLRELINNNSVFLVDANERETYEEGHIPGAVNFSEADSKFDQELPQEKDELIVCYCGSEKCLAWLKAAKELSFLGYNNVKHFKAGIKGWKKLDSEIEKG